MDSLNLKSQNSFQNSNNTKATHDFARRPLIVMLQQKNLNISDKFLDLAKN